MSGVRSAVSSWLVTEGTQVRNESARGACERLEGADAAGVLGDLQSPEHVAAGVRKSLALLLGDGVLSDRHTRVV